MRLRELWRHLASRGAGGVPERAPGAGVVSHRTFLKMLAAAATGAGLGQLTRAVPTAEAAYTPAEGSGTEDSVDRNLTVNGNLVVLASSYGDGKVGIGTATPQGKLDVAGDIRVNGTVAIASDGAIMKSYYAP